MRKIFLLLFISLILIFISGFVSAESGILITQNYTVTYPATPLYFLWNESSFSQSSLNATPVTGTLRWSVLKNNPIRREVALGTLDSNNDVKVQFYNSNSNYNNWSSIYTMTLSSDISAYRSFDVALEQNSGDVMVAYNAGPNGVVSYQIWNGTSWYSTGNITTNLSGQIQWIKMASQKYNDSIMLIAADTSADLIALNWNGTNWSTSYLLETALNVDNREDFDLAYEDSGDALIVWADTATTALRYKNFSNGIFSEEGAIPISAGQTANYQWIRLTNYPNSDRIMMCSLDAGDDLNCAEWTGSNWGTITEITTAMEYVAGTSFRNFDIVPDTSSNSFVLFYGLNNIDYYNVIRCFGTTNCQSGIWETTQTFLSSIDIGTDTSWVSLSYDTENVGKITAVMIDQVATPNITLARIACTNSANSCAANQTSTFMAISSSADYESSMFIYEGRKPTIQNVTTSSSVIKSTLMTIFATAVNDTNNNSLSFYCSTSNYPTASNTLCTSGNTSVSYPYTGTSCSYVSQDTSGDYTIYCRMFDSDLYSNTTNTTYSIDATPPSTTIISVANDTTASYIDLVNDGVSLANISGEAGMNCSWGTSDVAYSLMSNPCTISGIYGVCNFNGISTEGFYTRYISCKDSIGNEQNSSNNLNVNFYLDFSAPTTSDNSSSTIALPNYNVLITEADAVDGDPVTYYCTSSTEGCNPVTLINNGEIINYNSSSRGANYLRYYSIDFAGYSQTIVNKTININNFPTFTSATDNAILIKGGSTVNVSTVSTDSDAQTLSLFVCQSSGATSSGCTGSEYCSTTGSSNLTCTFTSESDSTTHNWYAYIFDELSEAATTNPQTGSYTTDSINPSITITSPSNTTFTQSAITFTIAVNEALTNAWYSLDSGSNNFTLSNTSLLVYTASNSSINDGNYTAIFWANDTYGNIGTSNVSFAITTSVPDTTAPTITVISPVNDSYYMTSDILFNISSDENLLWAGYSLDSGATSDLTNTTPTSWNTTISILEGGHNLTYYGNDSSGNRGSANLTFYVDLSNPQIVSFVCPSSINDSSSITCNISVTDNLGLSAVVFGHNATGTWQNLSSVSLSGTTSTFTQNITADNTSAPGFTAQLYVFDVANRSNTSSVAVLVNDNVFPLFYNITYFPNTTAGMDPGVPIVINLSVVENTNISNVTLWYQNTSAAVWLTSAMPNLTSFTKNIPQIYNHSFTPLNGTWIFKIIATDAANNQNTSEIFTVVVENETSYFNSTSIPAVKSLTLSQAAENVSLGYLFLNNTGETDLTFNLSITSSIDSRFSINYSLSSNQSFNTSSGQSMNLSFEVNTTSLPASLYNYTITIVSAAGTTNLAKQLYIQTATGPYLVVTIDEYSSTVTKGQTGVGLNAKVENLGTADATNANITWILPSQFSLTSGSLTRVIGSMPIGSSASNTIVISVSSSAADSTVTINASAICAESVSDSDIKSVTIGSPATITQTVTASSGGDSGGGGSASGGFGAATPIVYNKEIEVVIGEENQFNIEVENKDSSAILQDLTIELTGYLEQYFTISPITINSISPGASDNFIIILTSPSYKDYEVYDLIAVIKGTKINNGVSGDYTETQIIKLTLQGISYETAESKLLEAESSINLMKESGFNTDSIEKTLSESQDWLLVKKNYKQSYDLSEEIINVQQTAFEANDLIRRIFEALSNPSKSNLIVGNVISNIGDYDTESSLLDLLNKNVLFASPSSEELMGLAVAAFERGDYSSALQRAEEAQTLLILERKGNFFMFLYLYWPYILLAIFIVTGFSFLGYKKYQKVSITNRIRDLNKKEDNVRNMLAENQKKYFHGKITEREFKHLSELNQKEISKIHEKKNNLQNIRIKMLTPQRVSADLENEKKDVENLIKKIQEQYYVKHNITEEEYTIKFKGYTERLADIEDEHTTLHILKKEKNA